MPSDLNATVTMRYEINHGLLVLQVAPDEEMPTFSAGQYTVLGLPGSAPRSTLADPDDTPADPEKLIKRAYSVTSSSRQGRYFEFYVWRSNNCDYMVHRVWITPAATIPHLYNGTDCVGPIFGRYLIIV